MGKQLGRALPLAATASVGVLLGVGRRASRVLACAVAVFALLASVAGLAVIVLPVLALPVGALLVAACAWGNVFGLDGPSS